VGATAALTLPKSSKAKEQEEGKVAKSPSSPIAYMELGQEGRLLATILSYLFFMHPNVSLLYHSKVIARVDGDRMYTNTLHLPCMPVTNISTIANSDKVIATTLQLPCITDNVYCLSPLAATLIVIVFLLSMLPN